MKNRAESNEKSLWRERWRRLARGLFSNTFTGVWLVVMALAFAAEAQSNSAPVRLAVIVSDPSAATAADLLTVGLTKVERLQLLERVEIDRIRREQGLSASGQDNLKLGQLLGADGLLLLEMAREGTNQFLTVRLVAVKPGVVIGTVRSPWPVADPPQWARWIPARFGPLFPKLGVLVKDAIPISVVNLRSALRSGEAQEEEQQLTALAIERLTQERDVFVLERRRMDLLSNEKELKGGEESAFWGGSYLLDGVLDRDGYSKDTLTINARLTPPRGGVPVAIEIKGSRTNLADIVNQLAEKVTRELKLSPGTAWNPADEADQYFEEAGWEFKWGMLQEAKSACEAAWSLGRQTRQVAELRLRIWQALGAPIHWEWFTSGSPQYPPDISKLEPAIHALQLFQQDLQNFLTADASSDKAWEQIAGSIFGSTSELLNRCYHFPDAWRGHEAEVAELRELVRETFLMMERAPAYKQPYAQLEAELIDQPPWQDTPEQYMEICREVARSNLLDNFRPNMAYHTPIGWTAADQARVVGLRRQFVQDLCASTNALIKVDGYFLDFADAKSDEEYKSRGIRFFQMAAQNALSIVAGGRQRLLMKHIEDLLAAPPRGYSASPVGDEMHEYYYHTFKQDFGCTAFINYLETDALFNPNDFATYFFTMETLGGDGVIASPERVRKVLLALEAYKARITQRQQQGPYAYDFNNLQYVQGWLKRGMSGQPPTTLYFTNQTQDGGHTVERLPGARPVVKPGNAAPALVTSSTNVVHVTRFWSMPSPQIGYQMFPVLDIGSSKFREKRFWVQVGYKDYYNLSKAFIYGVDLHTFQTETVELPLAKAVLDLGNVKQESFSTGDSFEVIGDFVYFNGEIKLRRYSLRTKAWEILPIPVQGGASLTALNGRLFIVTPDSVLEMNEDGKGAQILASARRRPAINILDTIPAYGPLLLGPDGSLRVCANGKIYSRNMAGNDWSEAVAFPGKQATVLAALDSQIVLTGTDERQAWIRRAWMLSGDRSSFENVLTLPVKPRGVLGGPPPRSSAFRGGLPATNSPGMLRGPGDQPAGGPRGRASVAPPSPGANTPPKARWTFPDGWTSRFPPMALDGDNLWFFMGEPPERPTQTVWAANGLGVIDSADGEGTLNQNAGRHAHLLKFQEGAEEPRQIPLWFDLNKGILSGEWLQNFRHNIPTEPMELGLTIFQPTPEYFVIACANLRGFWLIPRSDLEGPPRSLDLNGQLLVSAESGDVAGAKDNLARGAAVDTRNYKGWTPLMFAAESGNLDMVRLLIGKGADVNANATTDPGATVLCFAVDGNNLDVFGELVKHGASVNAPGQDGLTPLYLAARNDRKEILEFLLSQGADMAAYGPPNPVGMRFTPLMAAAVKGHPKLVEMLLAKGANIEEANSIGDTALLVVARDEAPDILKLLIAKGAKVNATGMKGRTALFYAAYNGCLEDIKVLLSAGADPKAAAPDSDDFDAPKYDPATVARRQNHPLVEALIKEAQAREAGGKP